MVSRSGTNRGVTPTARGAATGRGAAGCGHGRGAATATAAVIATAAGRGLGAAGRGRGRGRGRGASAATVTITDGGALLNAELVVARAELARLQAEAILLTLGQEQVPLVSGLLQILHYTNYTIED